MKGELKRKTTRTVHGNKVVRLRLDIPYSAIEDEQNEGQDILEWLDVRVDSPVDFELSTFVDEDQQAIEEAVQEMEEEEGDDGTHAWEESDG